MFFISWRHCFALPVQSETKENSHCIQGTAFQAMSRSLIEQLPSQNKYPFLRDARFITSRQNDGKV